MPMPGISCVGAAGSARRGLQYVGSATYSGSESSSFSVSLNGTLTGGLASSPIVGDIVVVVVSQGDAAASIATLGVTGYSSLASIFANSNRDMNLFACYKVMTSTPDTSITVTSSNYTYGPFSVVAYVWRGVNSSNPIDVSTTTASGTNSVPNPPAITPVTGGAIVLAVGASESTQKSAQLSNFVAIGDVGIGSYLWPGGSFDPNAFTTTAQGSAYSWAAATMALRP